MTKSLRSKCKQFIMWLVFVLSGLPVTVYAGVRTVDIIDDIQYAGTVLLALAIGAGGITATFIPTTSVFYIKFVTPAEVPVPCDCPPNGHTVAPVIRVREVPRKQLIYPLHEINEDGSAVFILDNKLSMLDYGRIEAAVEFGTNGCYEFDIEYTHGAVKVRAVDVAYMEC